ncbi:MAG TPA: divalent-cation tolerance protein CutA [Bryobacteraceae bacterium]|jgi:periplasmic divalent cation tolerance protein|nr:divalent-cation tolerance protein CutA [Bryobacteraceae bacterium]
MDKIVVLSTCASREEAQRIARTLVEARLAACVNIIPSVTSVYRWEGRIVESAELLLIIKSSVELLRRLQEELQRLHSYEVPEILAVPVTGGLENYLNWMQGELLKEERP